MTNTASVKLPNVTVRSFNGRPVIHIDGQPFAMPTYSPIGWRKDCFLKSVPWFTAIGMGIYFVSYPRVLNAKEWGEQLFWAGDRIYDGPAPQHEWEFGIDEQIAFILNRDPDAYFIVRNGSFFTPSWCKLHPAEMFVDCDGKRESFPSMASSLWWEKVCEHGAALIRWCEQQPWAERLLGHWFGWEGEGTTHNAMRHRMFDYSEVMLGHYRQFLERKYGTVSRLRRAYGDDDLTFDTASIPEERLLKSAEQVRQLKYWQNSNENRGLRDYLACMTECYHQAFRKVTTACKEASRGEQLLILDCMKQTMQGWTNYGFFDVDYDWPAAYDEIMAASGHMQIAALLEQDSFDGIITPHDYQARGIGNVFEPEGSVDSCVLRGKFFFTEGDVRTYNDDRENGSYGTARDCHEFAAINWRNFATSFTRGFNYYWMDLIADWFGNKDIQAVIRRTVEVQNESLHWIHEDVPGIAMVLDDQCVLETNGSGNVLNELVMWEQKMGLAHCGVPYRIYLLEDLALSNFPDHHLFYFPNLYRVDDTRLDLLRRTVMRNGNVVLWGPGSGISDGTTLSPAHAARLTGFSFDYLNVNHPRRVHITNFDHPLTQGLSPDTVYGSPLAYGPLLHPKGGEQLGLAWTKAGRNYSGLAVKSFGRGVRSTVENPQSLGHGDWASVFTFAGPVPANLWRNLAHYSGTHVYSDVNDVVIADKSLVALHSIQSGEKCLKLPGRFDVRDVIAGELIGENLAEIRFQLEAPDTRVFKLE